MTNFKELRMKLTEENIKNILAKVGVFSVAESDKALVFPTACHNATGGSHKLYYYKDEKIFKCYTECDSMFDIFTLLQKIDHVRGGNLSLPEAIDATGFGGDLSSVREVSDDLKYLKRLSQANDELFGAEEPEKIEILAANFMDRFSFNEVGAKPWIDEGITVETLTKYQIKYDSTQNALLIPHWNEKGEIIGVRARSFSENAKAKYMPLRYNGRYLTHPTGKFLYGFHFNIEKIRSVGVAVIFEGEKSVMKMESFFPDYNVSLATSGKKITLDQVGSLLNIGINEVVLAYDKDYTTEAEKQAKIAEYTKIVSVLKPYFAISLIIDNHNKLNYKDSPIDQGKDIFLELMEERKRL